MDYSYFSKTVMLLVSTNNLHPGGYSSEVLKRPQMRPVHVF